MAAIGEGGPLWTGGIDGCTDLSGAKGPQIAERGRYSPMTSAQRKMAQELLTFVATVVAYPRLLASERFTVKVRAYERVVHEEKDAIPPESYELIAKLMQDLLHLIDLDYQFRMKDPPNLSGFNPPVATEIDEAFLLFHEAKAAHRSMTDVRLRDLLKTRILNRLRDELRMECGQFCTAMLLTIDRMTPDAQAEHAMALSLDPFFSTGGRNRHSPSFLLAANTVAQAPSGFGKGFALRYIEWLTFLPDEEE